MRRIGIAPFHRGCLASWLTLLCAACGGSTSTADPAPIGDPLGPPAASCGSLDAPGAARIATANLERVLRRASRALDFTNDSIVLAKLLTGSTPSGPWDHQGLDEGIDDFIKQAREHWFAASNLESESDATVVYRLRAEAMCGGSEDASARPLADAGPPAMPPEAGAQDAGAASESRCAKFYREHEVRLEVRRVACDAGENLHVDLVIGAERKPVLAADWFENRLSHGLDIGATVQMAKDEGAFDDDVVIDRALGRVFFEVAAQANSAATMELGFPQAVAFEMHGPKAHAGVAIGQAEHAIKLSADAAARRLTASTHLSTFDETLTLTDFVEGFFNRKSQAPADDLVTISVPGLDGEYNYDGASDTLQIQHLGLGNDSARVTRAGVTLLKIDANAGQARHVDVAVSADAQHRLVLGISPSFRLDLEYTMASVNPLVMDLEPFALDDTVTVDVEGAQAITMLETKLGSVNLLLGNRGFLLMPSARWAMTSRQAPSENVQLGSGTCLFRGASPFSGQHHILRELSSQPCP
jgi:hypothetical protein